MHRYKYSCLVVVQTRINPQVTGLTSVMLLCKCHKRLHVVAATPRHVLVALTGPMAALLALLGPRLSEPLPFHYACHMLLPLLSDRYDRPC